MSVEAAFQRLREANPVPDPGRLIPDADREVLLTASLQRSTEMQTRTTIEPTPQPTPPRRRRVLAGALAAIVSIVAVGLVVYVVSTGGGRPVGSEPPAPTTVPEATTTVADSSPQAMALAGAQEFVRALENLDADSIVADDDLGLVTPGATQVYLGAFGYGAVQPGSIHGLWEWGGIYDMTYRFDPCDGPAGPSGNGLFSVTCGYQLENDWTRALGQPPMPGQFEIAVSVEPEPRIVALVETFPSDELEQAWGMVIEWVQTEHPEDFDTMFLSGGESARLTPESLALWREYNPQIVASLTP